MLKKRCYVAMCILDLNEVLMYEFYFDYIKNRYERFKTIIHRH